MAYDPSAPDSRPSSRVVRPYVLTQGRTKAHDSTFALEAQMRSLVPTSKLDRVAAPEARSIVEFCQTPASVAEVAAHLMLPLGVTRVLVGDLVSIGAIAVDTGVADVATDVALLERLLDGIRAL